MTDRSPTKIIVNISGNICGEKKFTNVPTKISKKSLIWLGIFPLYLILALSEKKYSTMFNKRIPMGPIISVEDLEITYLYRHKQMISIHAWKPCSVVNFITYEEGI